MGWGFGEVNRYYAQLQTVRVMFRTSDPSEHSRELGRGWLFSELESTKQDERVKDARAGGYNSDYQ